MLARGVFRKCVRTFLLHRPPPPAIVVAASLGTASGSPALTKDRYPHVKRGTEYAVLDGNHLKFFGDLLGHDAVLNEPSECEGYNVDWIRSVRGYSRCVLLPKTTADVSEIMRYCNANKLAVCPQGGNTGLVGGSVPVFDEIVLSTRRMNRIISLDEIQGVLVCQAGCVLEALDDHLAAKNLMMPLDLGAKGSCHIGGNVSTNAGGLRLLRYGNLHGTVLGVEAVTADGRVVDLLSTLKKDNTGYHLKHLFIGSEGTLGVVTKVAIQCAIRPRSVNVAFLGIDSFDNLLRTFVGAKESLGEILSSFELIDAKSLDVVTDHFRLRSPIAGRFPFYVLVETHGSNVEHDEAKLSDFLAKSIAEGLVLDGTATSAPGKMKAIWELRERITEGLLHDGYVFKYDLSLPIKHFYSIVDDLRNRIGDQAIRICGYGHVGDGNIHLNVTFKDFSEDALNKIEPYVYEYTAKLNGSISAEHGVGFRKSKYMRYSKTENAINLMRDIKKLMDPNCILNPYKVLP